MDCNRLRKEILSLFGTEPPREKSRRLLEGLKTVLTESSFSRAATEFGIWSSAWLWESEIQHAFLLHPRSTCASLLETTTGVRTLNRRRLDTSNSQLLDEFAKTLESLERIRNGLTSLRGFFLNVLDTNLATYPVRSHLMRIVVQILFIYAPEHSQVICSELEKVIQETTNLGKHDDLGLAAVVQHVRTAIDNLQSLGTDSYPAISAESAFTPSEELELTLQVVFRELRLAGSGLGGISSLASFEADTDGEAIDSRLRYRPPLGGSESDGEEAPSQIFSSERLQRSFLVQDRHSQGSLLGSLCCCCCKELID